MRVALAQRASSASISPSLEKMAKEFFDKSSGSPKSQGTFSTLSTPSSTFIPQDLSQDRSSFKISASGSLSTHSSEASSDPFSQIATTRTPDSCRELLTEESALESQFTMTASGSLADLQGVAEDLA